MKKVTKRRYTDLANLNLSKTVKAILETLEEDRDSLSITLERKISDYIAEGRERL